MRNESSLKKEFVKELQVCSEEPEQTEKQSMKQPTPVPASKHRNKHNAPKKATSRCHWETEWATPYLDILEGHELLDAQLNHVQDMIVKHATCDSQKRENPALSACDEHESLHPSKTPPRHSTYHQVVRSLLVMRAKQKQGAIWFLGKKFLQLRKRTKLMSSSLQCFKYLMKYKSQACQLRRYI